MPALSIDDPMAAHTRVAEVAAAADDPEPSAELATLTEASDPAQLKGAPYFAALV